MDERDQVVQEPTAERNTECSAQLGALAAALAKAQAAIRGAAKDSENPHFRSRYADLASIWDACRDALAANGLAIVQCPAFDGKLVNVTTWLLHTSDQFIRSMLSAVPMKPDAQGVGSTITYLRRYALASMAGVAPDDDDGEAAVGRGGQQGQRQPAPKAAPKPAAAPQPAASPPALKSVAPPSNDPAVAQPDPAAESAAKWAQEFAGVTTRDELLSLREDFYAGEPGDRLKKMVEPAFTAAQKRVKAAEGGA